MFGLIPAVEWIQSTNQSFPIVSLLIFSLIALISLKKDSWELKFLHM